jgi:hypothetical protein
MTDPRKDAERLDKVNAAHGGRITNIIRLIKYWNKRKTMPDIGSYLLENMILDYYASQTNEASKYIDVECVKIFADLHFRIDKVVDDPKNLEGDLNKLSLDERKKIRDWAAVDYHKAVKARELEKNNQHRESIEKWGEIFGEEFPKFG